MNSTTGADATALSIADLISEERARKWGLDSWGKENGGDFRIHCLGMVARQNAYFSVKHIFNNINKRVVERLTEYIVLEAILLQLYYNLSICKEYKLYNKTIRIYLILSYFRPMILPPLVSHSR